jgi:1-acyl-sn-glycerol-3-phosphate acyltransferase
MYRTMRPAAIVPHEDGPRMLYLRSLAFNVAFYLNTLVQMIVFTPIYFLSPRKKAWWIAKTGPGRASGCRNHRRHRKPHRRAGEPSRGLLHPGAQAPVAVGHDRLLSLSRRPRLHPQARIDLDPALRLVRDEDAHDRHRPRQPSKALKQAMAIGRERMAEGRQLIIYPEGTRRPPGAEPAYKWGITELYAGLNVPVVPVAHVAGLYWPRRKFLRHPGTIHARFLKPIEPGLSKEAFHARLVAETEAATDQLLIEAATGPNPPPLPETARKRLSRTGRQPSREAVAAQ